MGRVVSAGLGVHDFISVDDYSATSRGYCIGFYCGIIFGFADGNGFGAARVCVHDHRLFFYTVSSANSKLSYVAAAHPRVRFNDCLSGDSILDYDFIWCVVDYVEILVADLHYVSAVAMDTDIVKRLSTSI